MDLADEIIDSMFENTELTEELSEKELPSDINEVSEEYTNALNEGDAEYMNYWQQELNAPSQKLTEDYEPYEYERETIENGMELERLRNTDFDGEILESSGEIRGEPEEDAEVWHEQTEDYSCALRIR